MDDSPLCCLGNTLAHLMPSSGCHPHHHRVDALEIAVKGAVQIRDEKGITRSPD